MDPKDPPALLILELGAQGQGARAFHRLLASCANIACPRVRTLGMATSRLGDGEVLTADIDPTVADAVLPATADRETFLAQVGVLLQKRSEDRAPAVLIVENDPDLAASWARALADRGFMPSVARAGCEAAGCLTKTVFDLVVLDADLPEGERAELLGSFQRQSPDGICLVVADDLDSTQEWEWMKRGAAACFGRSLPPGSVADGCARALRAKAVLREEEILDGRAREWREGGKGCRLQCEGTGDAVFVYGMEGEGAGRPGRFLEVSELACRRLGYTREELLGLTPCDTTDPVGCERLATGLGRLVRHGSVVVANVQVTKSGHRIPVEDHLHHFTYCGMPAVMCVSRDITERQHAEVSLRQLAQVVGASSDFIVLIGADYRYRFANDAYLRARRLRPADLVGHHMIEVVGTERFEKLGRPQVEAALRGEQVEEFEWADFGFGKKYYLHVRVAPFHESDGSISAVVMSGRDITDIKRVEGEKEKLQNQLTQAQKMELVGRLAGGVAHDFNNMLQAILGNTALALDNDYLGHSVRECLLEVQRCALRSADLTRQLLAFARRQTIAPRGLDLNDTVSGMLKMLSRLIGEHIDLVWLPGPDLGWVHMDPSQVDQILVNLCVNSRDAIGSGVGRVTIQTGNLRVEEAYASANPDARPGEYVRLAVSDTGCGMSPDVQAHLFEPFFSTKEVGQGTGLGLATVYGIVKQNQGFLSVVSEPGRGSRFEIHLPRHTPGEDPPGPAVEALGAASGGRETVLLVEDEAPILQVSQRLLEGLGYRVLSAQTPAEALQLARDHRGEIHLLLTDVVMPEMNGRELAGQLHAEYPGLRRLFMSGYTADLIAHHGVLDPGVHFIQKPFSREDLDAKVREALRS